MQKAAGVFKQYQRMKSKYFFGFSLPTFPREATLQVGDKGTMVSNFPLFCTSCKWGNPDEGTEKYISAKELVDSPVKQHEKINFSSPRAAIDIVSMNRHISAVGARVS